jgi:subtilisin family serine protease
VIDVKRTSSYNLRNKLGKRLALLASCIAFLLIGAYTLSPYVKDAEKPVIKGFKYVITSEISSYITVLRNKMLKDNTLHAQIGQASGNAENEITYALSTKDPYFYSQWWLNSISSHKAWQRVDQERQIIVAVVDSGVDYNHPDLKNRVLTEFGYNFHDNNNDPMDDGWHGTHIAGIIAAEANNGIGISGIVGDLDVKILPIKVLDKDGRGTSTVIAKGIRYAADMGADIINLSITFKTRDPHIEEALRYAYNLGVFVVTASGNDNILSDNYSPQADFGSFTVAAVNSLYERSYFSNYGEAVAVAAPGSGILSTVPGGLYEYRDGTSMAAPMVSGTAAILKAQNPFLSPDQLRAIITETADKDKVISRHPIGSGLLNTYNAIRMVN